MLFFMSASPDGAWLVARIAAERGGSVQTNVAFPTGGGSPVPMCDVCDVDSTQTLEGFVYPGSGDPLPQAFARTTTHRNIYRIAIDR